MSDIRADNGVTIGQTASSAAPVRSGTVLRAAPGGFRGKISGYAERGIDAVAGAAGRSADPRVDQAKDFVRAKPLAVAAAAGVIGLALLNTLRGRGRA